MYLIFQTLMNPDYTDYVTDNPDMNPDNTDYITDNPDTNES